ncbi:hypothetical protein F4802DRAFT_24473 [Xylaria palmicola]|nr:hypothetical protein F4802DRAFT_24473 [Xylaria palmicola]
MYFPELYGVCYLGAKERPGAFAYSVTPAYVRSVGQGTPNTTYKYSSDFHHPHKGWEEKYFISALTLIALLYNNTITKRYGEREREKKMIKQMELRIGESNPGLDGTRTRRVLRASNVSHYTNSERKSRVYNEWVELNHLELDSRGIEPRTTPSLSRELSLSRREEGSSLMLREYYTTKPQARGRGERRALPVVDSSPAKTGFGESLLRVR